MAEVEFFVTANIITRSPVTIDPGGVIVTGEPVPNVPLSAGLVALLWYVIANYASVANPVVKSIVNVSPLASVTSLPMSYHPINGSAGDVGSSLYNTT
jgi:hypothetical protein